LPNRAAFIVNINFFLERWGLAGILESLDIFIMDSSKAVLGVVATPDGISPARLAAAAITTAVSSSPHYLIPKILTVYPSSF
jgi:hypothetical protein